ncbi:MAG TPA: beta-ketoacyl-[acyl-carrier-protein] synthase family protein [Usitatibacter sp.]|jgi:3-oxoacyl-[acyl-carrier-protein] synthase II|nr:beta-ketoacyl-[acyl-carrier-protein] synthase family protein [Usitatibacter sp.]
MRRVVVTGIGVVSPLGNDAASFFEALAAGRSGVRRLSGRFHERLASPVGAPVDFDAARHFDAARVRMLDRVSQLALVAAAQAVGEARGFLDGLDRARGGVFVGTGMGGAHATDDGYHTLYGEGSDRLKPFTVLLSMANAPAAWIALEHRLEGPNLTYSTACSSSAVAIGEAARRIAHGEADAMIAGGAEAPLNFGTMKAWEALRTLAPADPADPSASCKPFAKDRAGLVLGEGAAMLVLEERERAAARGVHIHAEIAGYGLATDGVHLTRPSVEGQAAAMRLALADARMAPGDIGYVNAHGTGTQANDAVETAAIKRVLGAHAARVPVSSTKSMHGHLLGAAGALEMAAAILALGRGMVPPTRNLRAPDPECDLDYVAEGARAVPLGAVMSNSFAFGGTNAVLIARAA